MSYDMAQRHKRVFDEMGALIDESDADRLVEIERDLELFLETIRAGRANGDPAPFYAPGHQYPKIVDTDGTELF